MSRRLLWPVAITVLVLATLLLAALLTPQTRTGDLDPESAQPGGSRAVAQILRGQGVDVQVARRSQRVLDRVAEATAQGRSATVVVVQPQLVPLERWSALLDADVDLVLVEPDAVVAGEISLPVTPAGTVLARTAAPACPDPGAMAAGTALAGGQLYRVSDVPEAPVPAGTVLCYPDADDPSSGSLVVTSTQRGRQAVVIGQSGVLTNDALVQEGNAALALRLLGGHDRLVWYVPDPLEVPQDQAPSLGALLPPGLRWAVLQLAVAMVLVMAWRARRLGRLVREPLPVVVRAAETSEGRARLYRQAGGRDRAAATLRTAALRCLARRVDVGPDGSPDLVVARVAAATGRDGTAVAAVLLGPPPADDAELVRLADAIDAIEKDV